MTLMKRTPRTEMVWPSWFANGPLADWANWPVFTGESEIKVEEFTEDDHLVIRAELPGIDPDRDVEITVTDRMLTVRAERRREERKEESDGYRSEFSYGSFTRTMTLPTGADDEDITATYHDGILEVKVPVAATAEARKVVVARS
jgi:HSP20 family protein